MLDPLRPLAPWVAVRAALDRDSSPSTLPGRIDAIAAYHQSRNDRRGTLSDRTSSDLELDEVFRSLDFCVSAVGQQVLYDLLRTPLQDAEELDRRDAAIREMHADRATREGVARALNPLGTHATYNVHRLFRGDLPVRPRFWWLLPLLALLPIVGVIGLAMGEAAGLWLLLAVLAVNVTMKVYLRPRFDHLVLPIVALRSLVVAAEEIGRQGSSASIGNFADALHERSVRVRWVRRTARWLVSEDTGNEVTGSLAAWLNLIFLLDINAFVFSVEKLRSSRDDLASIFQTLGMLDALYSAGDFRDTLPAWTRPEFREDVEGAEELRHPVLDGAVPNGWAAGSRAVLVTGSNMAGKSTYLRTVGTAAILAQTLATVPALSWRMPLLRVETLIARGDDLMHGKSYFYAEAERVKEMLDLASGGERCFFIMDELFRGTNTRERVAAAHAVLHQLNRRDHLVLVATHDLELLTLLGQGWETAHFQESVTEEGVVFDYRIRSGPATAPNALRLLERLGYPAEVVSLAYRTYAEGISGPAQRPEDDEFGGPGVGPI